MNEENYINSFFELCLFSKCVQYNKWENMYITFSIVVFDAFLPAIGSGPLVPRILTSIGGTKFCALSVIEVVIGMATSAIIVAERPVIIRGVAVAVAISSGGFDATFLLFRHCEMPATSRI